MKSAQRLEKYQTYIVPEAIIAERKTLHVLVLLPYPLLLPLHRLSMMSYLLLQSTFPFLATRL
jgi:hypothetical protein